MKSEFLQINYIGIDSIHALSAFKSKTINLGSLVSMSDPSEGLFPYPLDKEFFWMGYSGSNIYSDKICKAPNLRKMFYVHCWSVREKESEQLWKKFKLQKNGLAIHTSLADLNTNIREDNHEIGQKLSISHTIYYGSEAIAKYRSWRESNFIDTGCEAGKNENISRENFKDGRLIIREVRRALQIKKWSIFMKER